MTFQFFYVRITFVFKEQYDRCFYPENALSDHAVKGDALCFAYGEKNLKITEC